MKTKRTSSVHTEGADIVFDVRGSGEPIILIRGAGGNASAYETLAEMLADQYEVITFDRRCNARSSGDRSLLLNMDQQARDVRAVLHAAGHVRATVFGNSSGGVVGLQLAALYPHSVSLLLVHEPPVIGVLPDAETWRAFNYELVKTAKEKGPKPAMMMFAGSLVGFSAPPAGGIGQDDDVSFLFTKELLQVAHFMPDFEAIRTAKVKVILLRGEQSGDAYYARTAPLVAEQVDGSCVVVPGNHLAFQIQAKPFAEAVQQVIQQAYVQG